MRPAVGEDAERHANRGRGQRGDADEEQMLAQQRGELVACARQNSISAIHHSSSVSSRRRVNG